MSNLVMLMKVNRTTLGIAGVILLVFVIAFGWQSQTYPALKAQEREATFKSVLEELNQRIANEGLLITLMLNSPVEGEGNLITVGIGNTTDEISIRIDAIGEDYVCLREIRGVALLIRCIPFSSIQSVTYLAN